MTTDDMIRCMIFGWVVGVWIVIIGGIVLLITS